MAILKRCEPKLLLMNNLESVLTLLKGEVPKWDEAELSAVLADAFAKPWTSRQLEILSNTENVETVAEGMERVMELRADKDPGHDWQQQVGGGRVCVERRWSG